MQTWRNMIRAFFSRRPFPRAEMTSEQASRLGEELRKQRYRGDMAGRSVLRAEEESAN